MTTEVIYIADDGKIFTNRYECKEYENSKAMTQLKNYIIACDENGKRLKEYNDSFWDKIDFCKIMNFATMPKEIKDCVKNKLKIFTDGYFYHSANGYDFINIDKRIFDLNALKEKIDGV